MKVAICNNLFSAETLICHSKSMPKRLAAGLAWSHPPLPQPAPELDNKYIVPAKQRSYLRAYAKCTLSDGPCYAETCLRAYADNKGQDQSTASAQSDHIPHFSLTVSLDTIVCFNGEQMLG